jgi:hypothetical protein
MSFLADFFSSLHLTSPDPAWLWRMCAFVVLWTAELFVVQGMTLVSPQDNGSRFAQWAPRIRLLINLCFVVAATALLPAKLLLAVSVATFFVLLGLISHYQYFLRPLSALTLYHNWHEGVKASGHRFSARPQRAIFALGAVLVAQVALLATAPEPGLPSLELLALGIVALVCYGGLLCLASWIDPLDKISTTRGIGRLGMVRGYLSTWLAEFYYLGAHEVLESAVRQREIVSDRLSPVEIPLPIRRQLIIIQAESLDHNVLGSRANGQEVTPFLNRLCERALFYRIEAARYIGSADADFVMLNGVMPSKHIITYNIPNYPYANALPQFLEQFGYRTSAFHGNTGNFYNRRVAFEKMGFAEIQFEEEMNRQEGLRSTAWGVEDTDVFGLSLRRLRASDGRNCHFIITLTTHTPYKLANGGRGEIFPAPQSMAQNFLNNMRYLDDRLREYIGAVGPAIVVIYSDHPADPALAPEFKPDADGPREFIPCLIYDTESDLGARQRTRGQQIALDGSLTLLDISTFLRGRIAEAESTFSWDGAAAGSGAHPQVPNA